MYNLLSKSTFKKISSEMLFRVLSGVFFILVILSLYRQMPSLWSNTIHIQIRFHSMIKHYVFIMFLISCLYVLFQKKHSIHFAKKTGMWILVLQWGFMPSMFYEFFIRTNDCSVVYYMVVIYTIFEFLLVFIFIILANRLDRIVSDECDKSTKSTGLNFNKTSMASLWAIIAITIADFLFRMKYEFVKDPQFFNIPVVSILYAIALLILLTTHMFDPKASMAITTITIAALIHFNFINYAYFIVNLIVWIPVIILSLLCFIASHDSKYIRILALFLSVFLASRDLFMDQVML